MVTLIEMARLFPKDAGKRDARVGKANTHCCACSGVSNVMYTAWALASREIALSQCCTFPYCERRGSMVSKRACRGSPLMRILDRLREATQSYHLLKLSSHASSQRTDIMRKRTSKDLPTEDGSFSTRVYIIRFEFLKT